MRFYVYKRALMLTAATIALLSGPAYAAADNTKPLKTSTSGNIDIETTNDLNIPSSSTAATVPAIEIDSGTFSKPATVTVGDSATVTFSGTPSAIGIQADGGKVGEMVISGTVNLTGTGPDKTYRVQVDAIPGPGLLAALVEGIDDEGGRLRAKSALLLRAGTRNAWLEIVLDEGRNRQIRRLLAALDIGVLRLLRVAIGGLALGELPKGGWRLLTAAETASLARPTRPCRTPPTSCA